jgi:purine nucleosidase
VGEPLRRILLDTDLAMGAPGSDIDDGFALALALADPGLQVELVTTVGGNTDVETSTRLTHGLLDVLGRGAVPVVQGLPASGGAAEEIARRVLADPGELTIVAIGPLTNVAQALGSPGVAGAVREVVAMGGVFLEHTNVAAMPGEYNFWCDPEAAQAVCESGVPLRFVGLDVTRRVRLSRDDARSLAAHQGGFGRVAAVHAEAWIDFQERSKPGDPAEQGSCALHDPLAVAVLTEPDLVTWQDAHVAVETAGRFTRGVSVADLLMWEDPPTPNCRIATSVDAEAFRRLFFARMASLP